MASGTEIMLVEPRPDAAVRAEQRLRQLERRWSRFIESSELTRINRVPGHWVSVSDDTIRLIETMQLANLATGGSYDPTQLHQLLALGYASSIDDPRRRTPEVEVRDRSLDIHDVEIDRRRHRVRTPHGVSLDPGGVGKGLAADFVVVELLAAGTAGALVSIGGDVAAAGIAPTVDGWLVNVEDPLEPPNVITTLAVSAGGVATSSTRSRRWRHDGDERHHVLDPSTGAMSNTDVASMTVVGTAGWVAEVHATAAMLRGTSGAIDHLDTYGLTGLAVGLDGTVHGTADLALPTSLRAGAAA